ncbi:MAG: cohesin domain-containing protein [Clostridia bacterium]
MKKQIWARGLVGIMVLGMLLIAVPAYAAGEPVTLSINGGMATPGGTVTATINVDTNTGFAGMLFDVSYDNTKFTCTGAMIEPGFGLSAVNTNYSATQVRVVLANAENVTKTGRLATLTFKAKDNLTTGTSAISITVSTLDTFKIDGQGFTEIVPGTGSGTLDIGTYKLGDVNGDNKVNGSDAVWIMQAAAQLRILTADQIMSADVDKSGKVNSSDAVWVMQVAAQLRRLD